MRLSGSESQKPRERFALPANARALPDIQSKRPLQEATQGKLAAAAPGAAGSGSAHRARPSGGRHCGTPAYAAARLDRESPAPELGQCGPHTPGPQRPLAPSCQRPLPTGLTASDARRLWPPSCTFLRFAPPAVYPDATTAPVRPLPRCGGQGASAWSHPLPGPPLGRAREPAADKPVSQPGSARYASDEWIGADQRTP